MALLQDEYAVLQRRNITVTRIERAAIQTEGPVFVPKKRLFVNGATREVLSGNRETAHITRGLNFRCWRLYWSNLK
jgi:hypothetical protein